MGQKFWPEISSGSALSQAQVQQAIEDAMAAKDLDIKDTRFHDASVTAINNNAGAWVNLQSSALTPQALKALKGTSTIGEPLELGYGPNAGTVTRICVLNRGDGFFSLEEDVPSGTQLWIRSLSSVAVSVGELTVNFLGE